MAQLTPSPGPPFIVATITASSIDGYTHLFMLPMDPEKYRYVTSLYAWSDGVVTWSEDRQDLTPRPS
jgi:hypothetical protein